MLEDLKSRPAQDIKPFSVLKFAEEKLGKVTSNNCKYNKKSVLLDMVEFAYERAKNDQNPEFIREKSVKILKRYGEAGRADVVELKHMDVANYTLSPNLYL